MYTKILRAKRQSRQLCTENSIREPEVGQTSSDAGMCVWLLEDNRVWQKKPIRRLLACNADVPIKQPQKCRQCIRSYDRRFSCPYLRTLPP